MNNDNKILSVELTKRKTGFKQLDCLVYKYKYIRYHFHLHYSLAFVMRLYYSSPKPDCRSVSSRRDDHIAHAR